MHSKRTSIAFFLVAVASLWLGGPPCQAGPVTVETKTLPSPAADPFVGFVSVGPKHEFEPIYRVLEPGACALLAHRVLVLNYANYDSLVVEELGFAGNKCRDMKVNKSYAVNGVTLGYALGEGTRFAWNIEFIRWETWDTFIIRSAKKEFRVSLTKSGSILAEPEGRQSAEQEQ